MGREEQRVSVSLASRSYDIVIKSGLISELATRLPSITSTERIGIVTDRHVARHYLRAVLTQCERAGFHPVPVVLPPGEKNKTLAAVGKILNVLAKERFERKSLLMALGGGVVGDVTGFAAAIYQRGIPFVQVPTTLVAQVDSSVGGKTGVDHRLGKNLIGAFHQPSLVLADTDVLSTLPAREMRAGYAEVVKYGLLGDRAVSENGGFADPEFVYLGPIRVRDEGPVQEGGCARHRDETRGHRATGARFRERQLQAATNQQAGHHLLALEVEPARQVPVLEHEHEQPVARRQRERVHDHGLDRDQHGAERGEQHDQIPGHDQQRDDRAVALERAADVDQLRGRAADLDLETRVRERANRVHRGAGLG